MDWPSHLYPFLPPDAFTCVNESGKPCHVIQTFDNPDASKDLEEHDLTTDQEWNDWFQDLKTRSMLSNDPNELIAPSQFPKHGFCVLFIPRAADVIAHVKSDLSDLPISQGKWETVAKAFYLLPGHIVRAMGRKSTYVSSSSRTFIEDLDSRELLWMHIAMTDSEDKDAFALASTYIDSRYFTLTVMFGCSRDQVERVSELLHNAEDGVTHPLLMLGIVGELQLGRLKDRVDEQVLACFRATRQFQYLYRRRAASHRHKHRSIPDVPSKIISDVCKHRNGSNRVEQEIKTVKRQLLKALPPLIRSFIDSGEIANDRDDRNDKSNNRKGLRDSNPSIDSDGEEEQKDDEVTFMFAERFADIFGHFEDCITECRLAVEDMSFTTDVVRSELARQEAKISAQQAKTSTFIAVVAMLYLPMTTIATIFAMPIFQWSNDWRDWRYNQVPIGNSTKGERTSDPPKINDNSNAPVFSGYFWIYLAVSSSLTLVTVEAWWRFTSREVGRPKKMHWTRYFGHKVWKLICLGYFRSSTSPQRELSLRPDGSSDSDVETDDYETPATSSVPKGPSKKSTVPSPPKGFTQSPMHLSVKSMTKQLRRRSQQHSAGPSEKEPEVLLSSLSAPQDDHALTSVSSMGHASAIIPPNPNAARSSAGDNGASTNGNGAETASSEPPRAQSPADLV